MARKKTIMAWAARDKKGRFKKRVYLYRLKPKLDTNDGTWGDRPGENWGHELPNIDLRERENFHMDTTIMIINLVVGLSLQPVETFSLQIL